MVFMSGLDAFGKHLDARRRPRKDGEALVRS
jgi:hypothetical protein